MIDLCASLASAIAWCAEHADPEQPRDSLRSRALVNPEEWILWLEDAPVANKAELLELRPASR